MELPVVAEQSSRVGDRGTTPSARLHAPQHGRRLGLKRGFAHTAADLAGDAHRMDAVAVSLNEPRPC
eukprot:10421272-Lingulodinium_polyedra.AAC.1